MGSLSGMASGDDPRGEYAARNDVIDGAAAYGARDARGENHEISANAARLAVLLAGGGHAAGALAGCGQGQQQARRPPPPTVTVAKPVQRTVVDQDEYVGRFVAVDSVEIRSRLSGYLSQIHFTDGQMVKQGDLLFTIDRRPFEIALEQMRANLAQARANLAFAEGDLERGQSLLQNKTITEQAYDQRTQAKAWRKPPSPRRRRWCIPPNSISTITAELRSPIDGRIGDRRVAVGNLVTGGNGGNTTLLATIVSVDPIRFEFTFDEASYLRYVRFATSSQDVASAHGNVPVALKLIDEKDFLHTGKIDFVDNVINQSSGTIRGRALFQNSDGIFTPGMFGRIRVPGSPPYTALLVPDAAIGIRAGAQICARRR